MEKSENGMAAEGTIKYYGWRSMPFIIGNETFEKLGTIGTGSNLLVYLTTVFNMKSAAAATLVNVFNGTANLTPVLGAFIADTFLGRYMILGIASVASLVVICLTSFSKRVIPVMFVVLISLQGMFILTLTAALVNLHPHCEGGQTCSGPTILQYSILLLSFGIMTIGAGGIRPCNLAFGADQFDPNTESGRRGISSFFNWYYLTYAFAMVVCSTVIIYAQSNVSWTLGLAIPTGLMFFSCVFFFSGSRLYVKVKPEGSPFTSIAGVLVAAFRKRRLKLSDNLHQSLLNPPQTSSKSILPHTNQFRFLDKALIITAAEEIRLHGSVVYPWGLCSVQQVEEVKCILRILPIWFSGISYYIALVQLSTYVVFQALQSNRRIGDGRFEIPAGCFGIFSLLTLTIWIPLYDRLGVPLLRKITKQEGGITLLQRIGAGIFLSIISMAISAFVEVQRKRYVVYPDQSDNHSSTVSSMSSLWLIPQLILMGLSEAFNLIGQVEFYYKQFPESMRSIAGSMLFCIIAFSNYLSSLMITIVQRTTGSDGKGGWLSQDLNDGKLEDFYFLIAVLGVINLVYFIICARWYRYKPSLADLDNVLEGNTNTGTQVTR